MRVVTGAEWLSASTHLGRVQIVVANRLMLVKPCKVRTLLSAVYVLTAISYPDTVWIRLTCLVLRVAATDFLIRSRLQGLLILVSAVLGKHVTLIVRVMDSSLRL